MSNLLVPALVRDFRHALAALRRRPAFVAVAVITLALGIGANTAIFSLVDALALHMFPPSVREPERIVWMFETSGEANLFQDVVRAANFADWKEQAHSLKAMTALQPVHLTSTSGGEPQRFSGYRVSADYFKVMGLDVAAGRVFSAADEREGADDVVILGDGLWKHRFGADPSVLGRSIPLDGRSYTVIGILPSDYNFPRDCDLLLPLALSPASWQDRTSPAFAAIGRLAPGLSLASAHAELDAISARLEEQYPLTNRALRVRLVPVQQVFGARGPLVALLAAVGFVLLIACANVANLELARGAERQREVGVRQALGASRGDVLRLLLVETLLIALGGGILGVWLAHEGLGLLMAGLPASLTGQVPWITRVALNRDVLAYALAVTLVAAVVSGLVPALRSSRVELHEVLKEGSPGAGQSVRRRRLAAALVVAQVTLAMVLLASAGAMMQSLLALERHPLGFRPDGVAVATLPFDDARYQDDAARARHVGEIVGEVAALPGATQVAASTEVPLESSGGDRFQVEGRPAPALVDLPSAHVYGVTPAFFAALGISVKSGRTFTPQDGALAPPVIVISDSIARAFFPDGDAIGQRIRLSPKDQEEEPARVIIGVVGTLYDPRWRDNHVSGDLYVPLVQAPISEARLMVRGDRAETLMASAVRVVHRLDTAQVVEGVRTLDQIVEQTRSGQRVLVGLLAVMAAIALLLASVGIYGVVSYGVSQRTRELGIRMALGAPRRAVLAMVLRQSLGMTGAGIAAGLALAAPLVRSLASIFYLGESPLWVPVAVVALIFAMVAFLASLFPAHRATRVDAMLALRSE